jgi:hypothetical protein
MPPFGFTYFIFQHGSSYKFHIGESNFIYHASKRKAGPLSPARKYFHFKQWGSVLKVNIVPFVFRMGQVLEFGPFPFSFLQNVHHPVLEEFKSTGH